ncbi:hypothetical protein O1611_g6789 [Lasiodiplodia mahajangana]|uniref:Uncharacterized protein n=1 Tax=Lasiodiplodia mahajangana TaxID=1108764 RepID=A0ACC2JHF0_9PEZI|nr:hypothetical protein O1611_g6789 [Lasiodiplodia mahajangana]
MDFTTSLMIIIGVFVLASIVLAGIVFYYYTELRWSRREVRTLEGRLERGELDTRRRVLEAIRLERRSQAPSAGVVGPSRERNDNEDGASDEFEDIELSISELAPTVGTAQAVPITHVQSPVDASPKASDAGRERAQNSEPLAVREIELTPAAPRA